jgi:predicted naringenin-chalcone synthase
MHVTAFRTLRPRYQATQEQILEWLVETHTREAEEEAAGDPCFDAGAFAKHLRRMVRHVCCGTASIAQRGFSVYERAREVLGGTAARTDAFAREVDSAFEHLYEGEADPPRDLVHVTCTGYVAPSGAQRLVATRGWGDRVRVTHAYHMGCYASVPALRIAAGLLASGADGADGASRADIVHTELCSLHFDPRCHTPEQLVVQSLFADGCIRYALEERDGGGLRLLAVHEAVASETGEAMQWKPGDRGMRMVLSREVPGYVGRAVQGFAAALFARGGRDFATERERAFFAIHPGGPRIIDVVRDALELRDEQVAASRDVLRHYGNMSSATLPHVWKALLDEAAVPPGALVASFAFGPGLTLAGALLAKE